MSGKTEARHLEWKHLEEYLETSAPAAIPIEGEPTLYLIIEPFNERIAIRGPWSSAGDMPNLAQYRYFDTQMGTGLKGDWIEFGIAGKEVLYDAYPLLVEIANRIQDSEEDMGPAISHVLLSYRELLSTLGRLSEQQQIGLFGELLIVETLIPLIGKSDTLKAWRGPQCAEHDFGLVDCDLEVKTTTMNERKHRISSLSQLQPIHDRDLWLVTVQLRIGGLEGRTLPLLIQNIDHLLIEQRLKIEFSNKLAQLGWNADCEHLYERRYVERNETVAYKVVSTFPSLTECSLISSGIGLERLSDISYMVNVEGLPGGISPHALVGSYNE